MHQNARIMEQYSFSMEIQKMFLEWLNKQGGNVVLLSVGIIALYYDFNSRTTEMRQVINVQGQKIEAQIDEIRKCDTERARLEARVEWLVSELSARFPNLKQR